MQYGIVLGAIAMVAPAASPSPPPRPDLRRQCGADALFRKADIPRRALAALQFEMADPEEPFQSSDSVPPGTHLPFHRLICAERARNGYLVRFEHGGFGYGTAAVRLVRRPGGGFVQEVPRGR